jgi:site-specific DNA recombinase
VRAAGYVRISSDPTGDAAGVARQRADVTALIDQRGWTLVEVFTDNDVSAYSGVRRPGWEALWTAVGRGEVDVVVAWHPDRLYRRLRDLVAVADAVERHGVRIATVTAGEIDFATPEGRLVATIIGAVAEKSSADEARRVARWHRARAEAGEPPTSGIPPFGYRRVREDGRSRWEIHPAEAEAVAAMYAATLAGDSAATIRDRLNNGGFTTAAGNPWNTHAVGRLLRAPAVAALREVDGRYVEGRWPPLVDRVTWERVQTVVRARAGSPRRAPRYPLSSGLMICGRCGTEMMGHGRDGRRRYGCRKPGGRAGGCGMTIVADPTERHVRDVLIAALDRDLLARLASDAHRPEVDSAIGRLAAIEDEITALADDYASGALTRRAFLAAASRLEQRATELRATVDAAGAPDVLGGIHTPDALAARWERSSPEWKRRFAGLLLDALIIAPSSPKVGRWDPDRIGFVWKV